MTLLLGGLAVYKILQVILALLPRAVEPWVKVVAGVILGFGAAAFGGIHDNYVLLSLSIATLAGATHTVLRLLTFLGDMAYRRSLK